MSKISCDIIQDMLPLYYDEVCSADSRKMIEEHLQECEKCSNIFQKLKTECVVDTKENAESIQSSVMGKMAHSWKRSLLRSFIIGIVITTIVLTAIFGTYYALFIRQNRNGNITGLKQMEIPELTDFLEKSWKEK